MARFLLHCFLLAAPVLGMLHWLNAQIKMDFAWAMDQCRIDHLKNSHDQYEMVIYGSSHFGRQVSPIIMDSLTGSFSKQSFLFSFDQLYAPLNIDLMEDILSDNSFRPKVLLFELSPIEPFAESKNLESLRVKSWYSAASLLFYMNSTWHSATWIAAMDHGFNHFRAWIGSVLSGGLFWERMVALHVECGTVDNAPLLLEGRSTASQGTAEIIALHDAANESDSVISVPLSDPYVVRLNSIAKQFAERGTCFVLVIPPRLGPDELYYLRGVGRAVSGAHFVDLSSAKKYPQFYRSEWVFDDDHLNSLAVPAFTAELAKAARSCNN